MNILNGKITAVEVNGSLSSVAVVVDEILLKSIIIETPDTVSYLKVGHNIKVVFKETEVIIGIGKVSNLSLQNKIPGKVALIEKGTLISKITIETKIGNIVSVISTNAVNNLALKPGQDVTAMIKTNEILLSE